MHHPPPPPHERELPPHEKRRKFFGLRVFASFIAGTVAAAIVGIILWNFRIDTNVILPVVAPVWAGTMTLAYTALKDRIE